VRAILVLAIVFTAAAAGVTIALGGVEQKPEEHKAEVVEPTGGTAAPEAEFEPERPETQTVVATVRMRRLRFSPDYVAVSEGDAIRFVNRDDVRHDVVAETGSGTERPAFDSGTIPPGGDYRVAPRFGTYEYVCTIHPSVMRGRIVVDP
jgi:plastocyanin